MIYKKSHLIFFTIRVITLSLIYFILLINCSLVRVVPVQIARISQIESYKQTFIFSEQGEDEKMPMDKVFTKLLGKYNWQNLKDSYGTASLYRALIDEKIYLEGIINITIYVDPLDIESFLLEGFGRYYLILGRTGEEDEILLSGDFQIKLDQHSISDLNRGYIYTRVKLYITRIPLQYSYLIEVPLMYKISMDTSMAKKRVYAIDYDTEHDVYLIDKGDNLVPIGKMEIGRTLDEKYINKRKLIDLRGLKFLRDDYKKIKKKSR